MPSQRSPTVFVISTCYDLAEIRDQLKGFIEGFGFEPLLSEFNSFPVNPLDDAVDNCCTNVRERADIFVLIVGNRFGSMDGSGKSITNLEYLQARAKGIPLYAFISRQVLDVLPVWRANPDASFPGVDSAKVYEFADSVRNVDRNWTYPFDKSSDIIDVLRHQWAYLFLDAIDAWTRIRRAELNGEFEGLEGSALRIAIEKPSYWEYRLFSAVLNDRLKRMTRLRGDKKLGLAIGPHTHVALEEVHKWILSHLAELNLKIKSINALYASEVIEQAFGPLGHPGDVREIVDLAERLSELYRDVLISSLNCHRIVTDERFCRLLDIASRFGDGMLDGIDEFAEKFQKEMRDLVANPPREGEVRTISCCLELRMPAGLEEEHSNELRRLANELGIDVDWDDDDGTS